MARITRYGHALPTGNLRPAPAAFTPELVGRIIAFLPPAPNAEPAKPAPVKVQKVKACVSDNGRAFASKRITAGAESQSNHPSVTVPLHAADEKGVQGVRTDSPSCPEPGSVYVGRRSPRESGIKQAKHGGSPATEAAPERKATAPVAATKNGHDTHSRSAVSSQDTPGASGTARKAPSAVSSGTASRISDRAPQSSPAYANNWLGRRHQVRDAVIAWLKARCILVTVVDRDALVRTYRISGKLYAHTLEQVVEYAASLGFEVPASA